MLGEENMRHTEYVVEGSGIFPVDMLRYDQSYPVSENDALHLIARYKRRVRLATYLNKKQLETSRSRWLSFGWSVIDPI